jgi:hypothetical protein
MSLARLVISHPEFYEHWFEAIDEVSENAPLPFLRRSSSPVGTRFIASVIHQMMFQTKHLMK